MFRKLFGNSGSPPNVDEAVKYFFDFALFMLSKEGDGPFQLTESEKYDFRTKYLANNGIEDHGVMFFAKIELEATNFTNHHLEQRTTFQIGMCADPVLDMQHPLVVEVKGHLANII